MRKPKRATAIEPGKIYGREEVARLVFGHSVGWLTHQRLKLLIDEHGFPSPISPYGYPRWQGEDLLAWQANRPKMSASNYRHAGGRKPLGPSHNDRLVAERTGRQIPTRKREGD